jgi:hypothetical protein
MSTLTTTTPATTTTTTPKALEPGDYGEMSAAELAKIINTDYGMILSSERINLPRAKAVGEKLTWLQAKAPPKEWQSKLAVWCPKLSYETANKYMRVYLNWPIIEQRAAAENVVTTDLTLDTALKLIAKPSKKATNNTGSETNGAETGSKASGGASEPEGEPDTQDGNDSEDDTDDGEDDGWNVAKDWLKPLAVEALIVVLRETYDTDYLTKLCAALAKALQPETKTTQPAAAPGAASKGVAGVGRVLTSYETVR